jgi:sodium transport system permease protein
MKEVRDALRDRRTLMAVVLSSVVMGPVLLFGLSVLVASSEERAESREVLVAGIEHAPSLRNFLERQTLQIKAAPADYERQLVERRLADPVVVVAAD